MSEEQPIEVELPGEAPPQEIAITAELSGDEQDKEEILDPGQNEGKKRDQSHVPPERFEEVYGKWKGTERKLNELSESLKSKEAVMEEVRKHNAALMDKIEKLSNKAIEAVETSNAVKEAEVDPPHIVAARNTAEELENRKIAALDKLDSREVIKIDKELRKIERVLDGYEFHKTQRKAEASKPKAPEVKKEEQTEDPDIKDFTDKAKWFGKDPIMTGAAKEYDFFLSQQPEWKDKPFRSRLEKVKETIEAKFSTRNEPAKPKPSGAESGLGLSRQTHQTKTVRLNEQQLAVAKGLGISPEDYAKQLNFLGGAV